MDLLAHGLHIGRIFLLQCFQIGNTGFNLGIWGVISVTAQNVKKYQ